LVNILFIPDELKIKKSYLLFFELQIKTLFQHAWSESEHDLNYKSEEELSFEDKQFIAFSSAQAWGADKIFNDLFLKYNKKAI
jgi:ppGpp synthetase/RelA/SpoT-type nucleotidyltranferase